MTKALKITAGGSVSIVELDTLEDYQREVGGYIEAAPLGDRHTMVLDEEGKLKRSAPNVVATAAMTLLRSGLAPADVIAGDVLVVKAADDSGDWGDVEDAMQQEIRSLAAMLQARSQSKEG